MSSERVLIVGASRGLGLGLAQEYLGRGWQVVGTVRGSAPTPLHDLAVRVEVVDITVPSQVADLRQRLTGETFDLLFVNAGVSNGPGETIAEVSTDTFIHVMVTNALSPLRVIEALLPLVRPTGAIAVMSSGLGSVADNEAGGWEVYRASKAALNTLMRSFAARHAGDAWSLLLIAPGWVRTDMGGPGAALDVKTSVAGVADAIESRFGRPGLAYINYQGKSVRW